MKKHTTPNEKKLDKKYFCPKKIKFLLLPQMEKKMDKKLLIKT